MGIFYYNSEFINNEILVIKSSNRAFNYADGFFETIKIINSKPFNFSAHYSRFLFACSLFRFEIPETESDLYLIAVELVKKNQILNGSVKVHVSRSEGGKYLPSSSNTEVLITANKGEGFKKNTPISLCLYKDEMKPKNRVSNVKTISSTISVLGAIYANEFGFDNAILMNIDGNCIEATNSNIFIIKAEKIYTPPLSDGCVDGTMRKWLMNQENTIEKSLNQIDIESADEVFLTNAISGIIPVKELFIKSTQIYTTEYAQKLQEKLINLSKGL